MNNIEAGGLTPFYGSQTMKVVDVGGLTTLCGGQATRSCFDSKNSFFQEIPQSFLVIQTLITFRDFQNRIGGRWCSLITLDLSPTRICNLSKVATID
jgi:hypothetical protein